MWTSRDRHGPIRRRHSKKLVEPVLLRIAVHCRVCPPYDLPSGPNAHLRLSNKNIAYQLKVPRK